MDVATLTLRGARSQQTFDVLLRTLAEPGVIGHMASPADVDGQPQLWLALALADVDISVAVVDTSGRTMTDALDVVVDATGCRRAPVTDASIVVVLGDTSAAPDDGDVAGVLDSLRRGTPLEPERSAQVALGVTGLRCPAPDDVFEASRCVVELSGPGIPGTRTIDIAGISPTAVSQLGTNSGVFPTGIDAWLFDPTGQTIAISRSTTVRVIQHSTTSEQEV
jgi:alpha-D-ribose 1-methylphosphonate 5-triphosphate synthase subunit PhnH